MSVITNLNLRVLLYALADIAVIRPADEVALAPGELAVIKQSIKEKV